MGRRYTIKPGKENATIISSKPENRKNGRYELWRCTQADLKYLHDVIGHPYIIAEDAKSKER